MNKDLLRSIVQDIADEQDDEMVRRLEQRIADLGRELDDKYRMKAELERKLADLEETTSWSFLDARGPLIIEMRRDTLEQKLSHLGIEKLRCKIVELEGELRRRKTMMGAVEILEGDLNG